MTKTTTISQNDLFSLDFRADGTSVRVYTNGEVNFSHSLND